eukprot:TRINITY_DN19158_c0_g1_i1.p1 TRINITY_DN19158_c0_g1~~TRINITY_DN19158_c0_g1_i1.p1  ORF type:complete len:352 (+),score=43.51 TRINITY_DN19158_c0_g1_i1:73-1128(+)
MSDRARSRSRSQERKKKPQVYLGTLTFGWRNASTFVDDDVATQMIDLFLKSGGQTIDTARCYSDGACEEMLGRCISSAAKGRSIKIDSKANPAIGQGLSRDGIRAQVRATLDALRVDAINVLYLHQPDPKNDLCASLECVHELVQSGLVRELGLSNFSAIETTRCIELCKKNQWTPPSVYQGIYNAVNRSIEEELLPILRKNCIRFLAYSPLAGGLLAKRQFRDKLPQKRVDDNPFYFNDECLSANAHISAACEAHGIKFLEATYSWLLHHSALQASDGIVIGAASVQQLRTNLDACSSSVELPQKVVDAYDSCWEQCKQSAYPYWRLYSRDMPNRQELANKAPGALFHCQ